MVIMELRTSDGLTITIPTTGRPEKLLACLKSIDYDAKVWIGAMDSEDIPSDIPAWIAVRSTVRFTIDAPVGVQIDLAETSEPGSHILPISDDIVFEPGAIQTALNALNFHFPDSDGVIGFNIKNMTEKDKSPYAFMLVGSKFFNERLNRVLFYPQYRHFFADTELGEYADSIGRFKFCEQAMLTHYHPSTGAPADATHIRNRGEKWEHDHMIYQHRKKQWQETGHATFATRQPIIQTAA
jgi:hypothetical protein